MGRLKELAARLTPNDDNATFSVPNALFDVSVYLMKPQEVDKFVSIVRTQNVDASQRQGVKDFT